LVGQDDLTVLDAQVGAVEPTRLLGDGVDALLRRQRLWLWLGRGLVRGLFGRLLRS